jgi:general secretion pathway protein E
MTTHRQHTDASRLERLVAAGLLNRSEAAHAAALQAQSREPLDRVLAQAGLLSESRIARFYADEAGCPHAASADALAEPEDSVDLAAFNPDFLVAERVLPLGVSGEACLVGLVDPLNRAGPEGIAFACGRPLAPIVLTQSLFNSLIAERLSTDTADTAEDGGLDVSADAERLRDLATAGPVVRRLDGLIATAVDRQASDVHVELQQREAKVRVRVDGVLRDLAAWPTAQALAVISRVKVLADLDIAERRRPQDGRFSVPVAGRSIDLRVSVVPGQYGESLVLRLLDPEASLRELEHLGLSASVGQTIETMLRAPHGLILVTGPTGSGKTTSLYAFLKRLANGERKILTIEDPIEYRLPGIAQSQTNAAIDLTFASALRAFLRHDPDVVMLGEIRDSETARTAVQAAMTGHLVLSTLHTNDAPSAVARLRDLGIEDFLIASTLVGVVAQRLVRRTCTDCNGAGCGRCSETGYRGRVPVSEAFHVTDSLRAPIHEAADPARLKAALAEAGYRTMWQDGLDKCAEGLTDRKELERALEDTGQTRPGGPHV